MKCLATFAFILLIAGRTHAAGNLVDGPDADLIYDNRTGDVVLDARDTPTEVIIAYTLYSPEGLFDPPSKLPCDEDGRSDPKALACVDLRLEGWETVHLGPVLPKGLTATDLSNVFGEAIYIFAMGQGGQFDVIVVPEVIVPWHVLALLFFAIRGTFRSH